jgi:hypothetical protein
MNYDIYDAFVIAPSRGGRCTTDASLIVIRGYNYPMKVTIFAFVEAAIF